MPNIPVSKVAATGSNPSGFLPSSQVNPSAFSAASPDIGNALQNLGASVSRTALQIDSNNRDARLKDEKEQLSNALAQADPTPELIGARDASKPDGSDLYQNTSAAFFDWVTKQSESIDNPNVRRSFGQYWLGKAPALRAQLATDADAMKKAHSRQEVGRSLNSLENRVRIDPNAYGEALQLGINAIAQHRSLNVPKNRQSLTERLARAKFEGQIEGAVSAEGIDLIRADLEDPEWQKRMSPADYDDTVDALDARRSSLRKRAVTTARANVADMEERTNAGQTIAREDLVAANAVAQEAGDVALIGRLARTARNQKLLTRYGSAGPNDLRAIASSARSSTKASSLPTPAAAAVDAGVLASRGGVTGSYLVATAHMEFGGELAKGDAADYGLQASTGTAKGLFQFTEDTWLSVVRSEGSAVVPNAAEKSDEELLKLRADPEVSARAASALAVRNNEYLKNSLGRDATEFETYLAHFLGAPKASTFLQAHQSEENVIAADMLPAEAKANPNVFYDGKDALTVQEMYDSLAGRFASAPGRVAYEDAEYVERMAANASKQINANQVGYARETGITAAPPLTENGGAVARATAAKVISGRWRIALEDVKPLEPNEVSHYKNVLSGENVQDKMDIMSMFSEMGPILAQSAYKQLGVEGRGYAHAAGILATEGDPASALDIVRGLTFLDGSPDFIKASGVSKQEIAEQYRDTVQQAVGAMGRDAATGEAWQTVLDAAFAHYTQTYLRKGGKGVDDDAFTASINAALGGSPGQPALDDVNGEPMVLPKGVSAEATEEWLYFATGDDWQSASVRGLAPQYGNGDVIASEDIAAHGTFEAVGAGTYALKIDGQYATTGRTTRSNQQERFLFTLDKASMDSAVAANAQAAQQGALTEDQASWLRSEYGALWGYDAKTGNRLSAEELSTRTQKAKDAVK